MRELYADLLKLGEVNIANKLFWLTVASREPGKNVGLFIPLPENLSKQYPMNGKEGEDSSPPHLTLLYIGNVDLSKSFELYLLCQRITNFIPHLELTIEEPDYFENDDGQKIRHSPIIGEYLHDVHGFLKEAIESSGFEVSNTYPDYKPHVTLEYVDPGANPKFEEVCPRGKWVADHAMLWGLDDNYKLPFRKMVGTQTYQPPGLGQLPTSINEIWQKYAYKWFDKTPAGPSGPFNR